LFFFIEMDKLSRRRGKLLGTRTEDKPGKMNLAQEKGQGGKEDHSNPLWEKNYVELY